MPEITTDDGVRLHYVIDDYREPWLGEPPATVLLHHGFTRHLEFWTPFVPSIARHYRVVRHDVRGAGKSSEPPPSSPWTLDRMIEDVVALTDALGIRRVHHVGAESGGIVGLVFAARYPERTASVTCFNTPYRSAEAEEKMHDHFCVGFPSYEEAIDTLGVANWLAKRREQEGTAFKGRSAYADWVAQQSENIPASVAKGWHRVFERTSDILSDVLPRVTAPVQLVAGGNLAGFRAQFGCEPERLNELRSELPNAREVVYIPGAGTSVQLVAPDACAAAYLAFLASLA